MNTIKIFIGTVVVFVLLALPRLTVADANETVRMQPSTYYFQNSTETLVAQHWGIPQMEAVALDQGYSGIESIIENIDVQDIALLARSNYTEIFLIGRNKHLFASGRALLYAKLTSLDNILPQNDIFGMIENIPNAPDFRSATGLDAWVNEYGHTNLAVCDWADDRITLYAITNSGTVFSNEIEDDDRLVQPMDVVKYRTNGGYTNPTYIAVLSLQGNALLVYDYSLSTGNQFRSSFGLPQQFVPPGATYTDNHTRFLGEARSITSQHGYVYVCDTGNKQIAEFSINYNGILSLHRQYQLPQNTVPVSITGDLNGGIYVADAANDEILVYSSRANMVDMSGPLRLIDKFGRNEGESLQLQAPHAIAANGDRILIAEEIGQNSGLVQGRIGGKITQVSITRNSNNFRLIQVFGMSTGYCSNVTIHSKPVGAGDDQIRSTVYAQNMCTGVLRGGDGHPPFEVNEDRNFGEYEVWITWSSASCQNGGEICCTPQPHAVIQCGQINDPPPPPALYNCTAYTCPNIEICWDPIPLVNEYSVQWRQLGSTTWNYGRYIGPPFVVQNIPLETVYEILVRSKRSGQESIDPGYCVAAHGIDTAPTQFIISNRSGDAISFNANVIQGANAFRLYYGTAPDQINIYGGDFWYNEPIVWNATSTTMHDQIYYFQIAATVRYSTSTGFGVASIGPRSSVVSAPLAPTTSGTISWPERWFAEYDPVVNVLAGNLVVAPEGSLTIDPGVAVNVHNSSEVWLPGLKSRGTLACDGATFTGTGQPAPFSVLEISGGSATLENIDVQGGFCGVFAYKGGRVHIDHSVLHDNVCNLYLLYLEHMASIEDCELSHAGYGAVLIGSNPAFLSCEFADNSRTGLMVISTQATSLVNNVFSNNGTEHRDVVWDSGIRVLKGYVKFRCNTISDNNGPGIALLQGMADLTTPPCDYPGGRNVIQNNCTNPELQNIGQIYYQGTSFPDLFYGLNTITSQNGSMLIRGAQDLSDEYPRRYPDSLRVQMNYWGTVNGSWIRTYLPDNVVFEPFLPSPIDCPQPEVPTIPIDNGGTAASLLRAGLALEMAASFVPAINQYKMILGEFPDSKEAIFALDRLEYCQKLAGQSWPEVRGYFLGLADTVNDQGLRMAALNTAAWCLIEMGEFGDAEVEFQSLVSSSVKAYDIICNSMGALISELKDLNWVIPEDKMRVSDANGRNSQQRPSNFTAAQEIEKRKKHVSTLSRIDSLLMGFAPTTSSPDIPITYGLYQNYPNPFNPNTEIRFDLPEMTMVQLKIFNILGQEVTTLIDEVRPAGAYRIMWDSKSASNVTVASGVYVYQIKAGNFVDSKKMVLIR